MEKLGSLLGGWDDKNGTAAKYKSADSNYRTYKPTVSFTPESGFFISTKIDHICGWAADEHAQLEMDFARYGKIISIRTVMKISGTPQIDTIIVFNGSEGDKINVSASGFGGGLTIGLSSNQFTLGAATTDASDRFIYNSSTGGLFFDVDGVGGLGQTQLAFLSKGLNLPSNDFSIIA